MFRLHCSPALVESQIPPLGDDCLRGLSEAAQRTLDGYPAGGLIDIILTDDNEVRRLNHSYRGRDSTTDVLSFSLVDDAAPTVAAPEFPPGEEFPAGEVYISVPQAAEQARRLGVPLSEELARLLVHGLLHLAGYDHQTEAELQHMERLTEDLLHAEPGSPPHPSWQADSPKGV